MNWKRLFRKRVSVVLFLSLIGYVAITFFTGHVRHPAQRPFVMKNSPELNLPLDINRRSPFRRVVHLDLKGAPPKMSYLLEILPFLVSLGCDALLIEYEDMFPYDGVLKNISASNAYEENEIVMLIDSSKKLGLELIPLVQTFGHMEFVLKLEEFQYLREVPEFPADICPLHKSSFKLVAEMLSQVMAFHTTSKFIHIGGDEVFNLGACESCSRFRDNKYSLYEDHLLRVAKWVRLTQPGVTILIWDDMIRLWPPSILTESRLPGYVVPVVWSYATDITRNVPPKVWHWYGQVFPEVWIAGAFKGYETPNTELVDLSLTLKNLVSWGKFYNQNDVSKLKFPPRITGWVTTGWSRFDHFSVLCELLPPSIPSIALSLLFMDQISSSRKINPLMARWASSLKCLDLFNIFDIRGGSIERLILELERNPWGGSEVGLSVCSWPGRNLFVTIDKFLRDKQGIEKVITNLKTNGWISRYNVKHNATNPWRLQFETDVRHLPKILAQIIDHKARMRKALSRYFGSAVVFEWIEQKFDNLQKSVEDLQRDIRNLVLRRTWPSRPFL